MSVIIGLLMSEGLFAVLALGMLVAVTLVVIDSLIVRRVRRQRPNDRSSD